ncbi:hypothetical protein PG984_014326 [Apiospora sp. TS-2023a]
MSKETFFAAASASCANQGQPNMSMSMRPTTYAESSTRVYRPYTTPYTGVGQVVGNQQPMAATGFTYSNGSIRPVAQAASTPIYEMPALITPAAASVAGKGTTEETEAPSIFTVSKIDVMVDRYRTLGLSKDQTLDATHNYPEAKGLTDKDLEEHVNKLLGRGHSRFSGFRQWSRDTGFADKVSCLLTGTSNRSGFDRFKPGRIRMVPNGFELFANEIQNYKSVAAKYLIVTDIPKADPGGKTPRDDKRRAARLNAIFEAVFAEAELRQYKTERTGLPTSMDANTAFAAAEFVHYDSSDDSDDSDSSDSTNSDDSDNSNPDHSDDSNSNSSDCSDSNIVVSSDSDDSDSSDSDVLNASEDVNSGNKDISEFIENPDGSVTFNPAYLEFMNSKEARELRAAIKASLLIPGDKKDKAEDIPTSEPEDDLVVVEPLSPVLDEDDDNE